MRKFNKKEHPGFIADSMLGKLCKWLRILGFDCAYLTAEDKKRVDIHKLIADTSRIFLTMNKRLRDELSVGPVPYLRAPCLRRLSACDAQAGSAAGRDTHRQARTGHSVLFFIHNDNHRLQLVEVIRGLGLEVSKDMIFSRCTLCNEEIEEVLREDVKDRVPPYVFSTCEDFSRCPKCDRIYWPATHREGVEKRLKALGIL